MARATQEEAKLLHAASNCNKYFTSWFKPTPFHSFLRVQVCYPHLIVDEETKTQNREIQAYRDHKAPGSSWDLNPGDLSLNLYL